MHNQHKYSLSIWTDGRTDGRMDGLFLVTKPNRVDI